MFELLLYPPTQPGVKDPQGTSLGEALASCFPSMMDGAGLERCVGAAFLKLRPEHHRTRHRRLGPTVAHLPCRKLFHLLALEHVSRKLAGHHRRRSGAGRG